VRSASWSRAWHRTRTWTSSAPRQAAWYRSTVWPGSTATGWPAFCTTSPWRAETTTH